ncbi:MAG: response regulator transcription factor [Gammaproteobacteria bacterium]|nr:response regulator transcription factor [Gammaproteobacteria bacterium]
MRLLLVEDSSVLRENLSTALATEGYAVDAAADGNAALARYRYDLVVLDLMLPGVDGLGVLRKLRAQPLPTRVLVLSARDQIGDRVEALARRRFDAAAPRLTVGTLTLDTTARLVAGPDGPITLSPKEYALLELLLRERRRVHTRTDLFERLYSGSSTASDKVIEVLISTLRGKFDAAGSDELIETRRGLRRLRRQPRVRVGVALVRVVAALRALEVHFRVARTAAGGRRRSILRYHAALGGPGAYQRAIDREVLGAEQSRLARPLEHALEELAHHLVLDQPVAVLAVRGVISRRALQGEAHKPAIQQVVAQLIAQQAFAA